MDDKLVDNPVQVQLRGKAALRAVQVSLEYHMLSQRLVSRYAIRFCLKNKGFSFSFRDDS